MQDQEKEKDVNLIRVFGLFKRKLLINKNIFDYIGIPRFRQDGHS